MPAVDLNAFLRDVPDFPKPGIMFKDITPLLGNAAAFSAAVEALAEPYLDAAITTIAAIESRGFIFGGAVARLLGCGFVPIRKPGKLPMKTFRHDYSLEYGSDVLEIHEDAIHASDRVVIIDDVLATGGTAAAAIRLVSQSGASIVGVSMLVELRFLNGRSKIAPAPLHAVLGFD